MSRHTRSNSHSHAIAQFPPSFQCFQSHFNKEFNTAGLQTHLCGCKFTFLIYISHNTLHLLGGGLPKHSIHSCTDTASVLDQLQLFPEGATTATRLKNEMLRDPPEGRGRAGNEGAWPCAPSAEDSEPGRCRSRPHRGTSDSQ